MGMRVMEIASNGALVIYLLLGLLICVLALPDRKLAACIALVAPSVLFLVADFVQCSNMFNEKAKGFMFQFGLLGGPILFSALALLVGLSRERKRKKLLLMLSALGLTNAIAITMFIVHALGQIP